MKRMEKRCKRMIAMLLTMTLLVTMCPVMSVNAENAQQMYMIENNDFSNAKDIQVGETSEITFAAGERAYFRFVPEQSGNYVFQSYGNMDTYGEIYSSFQDSLSANDDGTDSNFMVSYSMTAGQTYFLVARLWSSREEGKCEKDSGY